MNCGFAIHAIYPLTLTTYKYNELQVSCTTQKLNCKANYKTPFFFHNETTPWHLSVYNKCHSPRH